MVQDAARKPRGRTAQAEESYEVIKAQEQLIVEVQTGISRALRERSLKQIDLAERLGVSQARVSQMFGEDAQNLTLRTLAKIYHVLGSSCHIVETRAREAAPAAVLADSLVEAATIAPDIPVVLAGSGEVIHYRFHKVPSSDQVAASHRFKVRRHCPAQAQAAERAYA